MDDASKVASKSEAAERLLWFKMLRDFVLLALILFGGSVLIDPFHYKETSPYHMPGSTVWGYLWQVSLISAVAVLVKYFKYPLQSRNSSPEN
jgi:hypothetical protein